jgi:hypothetical protein
MRTGEGRARRSPAHAGRLPVWERLALTVVLALIGAGIGAAVVSGSAQPAPGQHSTGRNAGAHPVPRGSATAGGSAATDGTPASLTPSPPSKPQRSQPGQAGGAGGRSQ